MKIDLQEQIELLTNTPSDINEHFGAILDYGKQCKHITEMGVRGVVSTWGWLASKPVKLICYDLYNPSKWGGTLQDVYDTAKELQIDFTFIEADVLSIQIEPTDLLFIDTWHTYDQLSKELEIHSKNVKKYIAFHDTTSYEYVNESMSHEHAWTGNLSGKQGIWSAIEDFLNTTDEWILEKRFTNNNGFTIIKRIQK
jgi:hypothetical protein